MKASGGKTIVPELNTNSMHYDPTCNLSAANVHGVQISGKQHAE